MSKYFLVIFFLIFSIDSLSQAAGTPFFPYSLPKGLVRSKTGRIWMDKNLGAKRVAESANDTLSIGFYYQWGRNSDGHQELLSAPFVYRYNDYYTKNQGIAYLPGSGKINDWQEYFLGNRGKTGLPTYFQQSSTDSPGHNSFIAVDMGNDQAKQDSDYQYTYDWRFPSNDELWHFIFDEYSGTTISEGINNPCPLHFRPPTYEEWVVEISTWTPYDENSVSQNGFPPFDSPLKLPFTSFRDIRGQFDRVSQFNSFYLPYTAYYWSSSANSFSSTRFYNDNKQAWALMTYQDVNNGSFKSEIVSQKRAMGMPVRCILDENYLPKDVTFGDYSIRSNYSFWHP